MEENLVPPFFRSYMSEYDKPEITLGTKYGM